MHIMLKFYNCLPTRVCVCVYAVASFLFTLPAYSLVCLTVCACICAAYIQNCHERERRKRRLEKERDGESAVRVWSTYVFVQQIWALLKYLRFARFDYTDLCFISMLVCYVVWWYIRISSQLERISTFQKLNKAKPSKASALNIYGCMLNLMSVLSACVVAFLYVYVCMVQVNRHNHFRNTVPAAFLD